MDEIKELREKLDEARARVKEIDTEYRGKFLDPDSEDGQEWNRLNGEVDELEKTIAQCEKRAARIADLEGSEEHREAGATFRTQRSGVARGDDIYDMSTIRMSAASPDVAKDEFRDRALRGLEKARFAHPKADQDEARAHVERLIADDATPAGEVARHILATGSPTYKRAFGKHLSGAPMSADERAALATGSIATGGAAVPFELDPTIVHSGNHSVNPYRAISRVVQTTSNEWKGITADDIEARYSAEGAVVGGSGSGDDAPTLVQPNIIPERADAWIPFSIESGQDWTGLQPEMARLLQRAKDNLEATKFTLGAGHGSLEPQGVLTGATITVPTVGGEAVAGEDVYGLEEALPAGFRPDAQFVASRAFYNKIRQLDKQGGSELWLRIGQGLRNQVPTPGNTGAELLGYPANECSAFASTVQEDDLIAVLGDFSQGYVIVDRIGMAIELVPHVFDPTTGKPTGQRGLMAIWRNSAEVIVPNAFRVLEVSAAASGSGSGA